MSSKPISFGFGKPKGQSNPVASSTNSKTSISLPGKAPLHGSAATHQIRPSALRGDEDDDQDDEEPKHEELTGFSSSGAILSKPVEQKKELVIENAGNQDWRRKAQARGGKNLLPTEVQAQRRGEDAVMVEKNEVSKASGLQFATPGSAAAEPTTTANAAAVSAQEDRGPENKPKTADEEALQALLNEDEHAPRGNAIIDAQEDARTTLPYSDPDDFASLVATHPDSATLDEYAAMPVEEFGMAMLRGMGKKRRANGEVIQLESTEQKETKKRKQEGFLGIGARPAPGMEGVELGAWGKSEMRRNQKGQGFFTPVMVRDKRTGETITEEELERRKKGAAEDVGGRKDHHASSYEDKDKLNGSSRRTADKDDGHESVRSRRHRSRSRERERERRRRDVDDGYDSRASGRHRDRDRDRDRDRGRRHGDRDRDYDRDERRHKDRNRDRR